MKKKLETIQWGVWAEKWPRVSHPVPKNYLSEVHPNPGTMGRKGPFAGKGGRVGGKGCPQQVVVKSICAGVRRKGVPWCGKKTKKTPGAGETLTKKPFQRGREKIAKNSERERRGEARMIGIRSGGAELSKSWTKVGLGRSYYCCTEEKGKCNQGQKVCLS